MSAATSVYLFLFGPGSCGLLLLLLVCIFSHRLLWLIIADIIAFVLLLISFALIAGFVGIGEATSGYGPGHDLPVEILLCGLLAIIVLTFGKLGHLVYFVSRKERQTNGNANSTKDYPRDS